MSFLDLEELRRLAQGLVTTHVEEAFGSEGTTALKDLLRALLRIYAYVEPESLDRLQVFRPVQTTASIDESRSIRIVSVEHLSSVVAGSSALKVNVDGTFQLWTDGLPSAEECGKCGPTYELSGGAETIRVLASVVPLPRPLEEQSSLFARPSFRTLSSALDHYSHRVARQSKCAELEKAWRDSRRIRFDAKPEKHLRKSLYRFLMSRLRDAEVREEQNVNESRPVDVKIAWQFSNRQGLVEVKWLGRSLSDDGKETRYSNSRAVEGAEQLAEYLDLNTESVPGHVSRGYLIVFDGRRKHYPTQAEEGPISGTDAMHYENKELVYPDTILNRKDFESPRRFFMEPVSE